MKKLFFICILLLVIAALVAFVWWQVRGVSNNQIYDAVKEEAQGIKGHIDRRGDRLEAQLDHLEEKLDGVEKKLDKILELATRPLPDGMKRVD